MIIRDNIMSDIIYIKGRNGAIKFNKNDFLKITTGYYLATTYIEVPCDYKLLCFFYDILSTPESNFIKKLQEYNNIQNYIVAVIKLCNYLKLRGHIIKNINKRIARLIDSFKIEAIQTIQPSPQEINFSPHTSPFETVYVGENRPINKQHKLITDACITELTVNEFNMLF